MFETSEHFFWKKSSVLFLNRQNSICRLYPLRRHLWKQIHIYFYPRKKIFWKRDSNIEGSFIYNYRLKRKMKKSANYCGSYFGCWKKQFGLTIILLFYCATKFLLKWQGLKMFIEFSFIGEHILFQGSSMNLWSLGVSRVSSLHS